jgi:ABC-type nitrate/sulfonate/bicarbonate transport system ATPase subunit
MWMMFLFSLFVALDQSIILPLHQVDEALFRAGDVFMMTANKLAERVAENVRYLSEDSSTFMLSNHLQLITDPRCDSVF